MPIKNRVINSKIQYKHIQIFDVIISGYILMNEKLYNVMLTEITNTDIIQRDFKHVK